MYRHIKEYEIKYTEVDAFDNLKPSALLSFMEESACLSADELGFGYKDISPKDIGFILANAYIELSRPVKLGEKLVMHTWPLPPKMLIFLRDFELYVGNEKVGACTTRWCMIDTKAFKPLPVSAYFGEGAFDDYNIERSVQFTNWKIPSISEGKTVGKKNVKLSDYDHYFHVNNTKYADYLYDTFSLEDIEGKYFCKLQITYSKQCKLGEEIIFTGIKNGADYIIEGKVNGELRVAYRAELSETL